MADITQIEAKLPGKASELNFNDVILQLLFWQNKKDKIYSRIHSRAVSYPVNFESCAIFKTPTRRKDPPGWLITYAAERHLGSPVFLFSACSWCHGFIYAPHRSPSPAPTPSFKRNCHISGYIFIYYIYYEKFCMRAYSSVEMQ